MKSPKLHSDSGRTVLFLKMAVFFFLSPAILKSQAFFNLTSTLCAGNSVNVSAQTGNIAATGFSWTSAPTGLVFSTPNGTVSDIYFSTAGTYTIQLDIANSSSTSSATQIIVVYPLPGLSLYSSANPICVNSGATLTAGGAGSYSWNPPGGLYFLTNLHDEAYASPAATTVYTITGASPEGCLGSVSFTQIVNPYPLLVISANTTSVCSGSYATLIALGASNYSWTGSGISGSLVQTTLSVGAGTYSLTGAIGICTDSTSLTIDLASPLVLNLSASRSSICKDDNDSIIPVLLSASGVPNMVWQPYLPGRMTYSVGPTTAVSPTANTCFTVTGSDNFCSGKASICLDIITCTSLEEKQNTSTLKVFPNPVTDQLVVSGIYSDEALLKIKSICGETLASYQKVFTKETVTLSIQELPAGIYFLSVEVKGQSPQQIRVIKQ